MSEHTFKVNHHRMATDPHLVEDEVAKCAYRANKPAMMVACTELAETRKDLQELREEKGRLLDEARKAWNEQAAALQDAHQQNIDYKHACDLMWEWFTDPTKFQRRDVLLYRDARERPAVKPVQVEIYQRLKKALGK